MLNYIMLAILIAFPIYNHYLAIKDRNIKYTYKIKNTVYWNIRKYNTIKEKGTLKKYEHIEKFINEKMTEIAKLEKLNNVKNLKIKIYKDKNLQDTEKFIEELKTAKCSNEKYIIDMVISCIELIELILRAKRPCLYLWYKIKIKGKLKVEAFKELFKNKMNKTKENNGTTYDLGLMGKALVKGFTFSTNINKLIY